MSKQIFSALRIIALALILSFGVSYVYAWVAPTSAPTGGNKPEPVNVSATAQTKSGGLTVGSITAPQHCIGASCITSWPAGGVGGSGTTNYIPIWTGAGSVGNSGMYKSGTGAIVSPNGLDAGVGLNASRITVWSGGISSQGSITAAGITTTNRLTVSEAGGAYTYITLKDDESPNGVKYIHANSNLVGFLSGYGSWLSYWDNAGNQRNIGSVTATDVCTTAGKCLSAAGGGTPSIGVYSCPVGKTPGANPWGGAWGYYGCAGQVSTISYCTNIEYPWSENRGCTYLGALRIN